MSIIMIIMAAFLTLGGIVCAWAWLICLGRGAERLAARPAALFAVVLFVLATMSAGAALAHDPYTDWKQPGSGIAAATGWLPIAETRWRAHRQGPPPLVRGILAKE